MKINVNGCCLEIWQGDISQLPVAVDALVSSDDNYLTAGGGVSYSLLRAARSLEVRAEMNSLVREGRDSGARSRLAAGDVVVTSAGALRSRHLFHAVVIDFDRNQLPDEAVVQRVAERCLELATERQLTSIAVPTFGAEAGQIGEVALARIIASVSVRFLSQGSHSLKHVIFAAFSDSTRLLYEAELTAAVERQARQGTRERTLLAKVLQSYPLPIALSAAAIDLVQPRRDYHPMLGLLNSLLIYLGALAMACAGEPASASRASDNLTGTHPRGKSLGEVLDELLGALKLHRPAEVAIPPLFSALESERDRLTDLVAVRNRLMHSKDQSVSAAAEELWAGLLHLMEKFDFLVQYPLIHRGTSANEIELMGAGSVAALGRCEEEAGSLWLRTAKSGLLSLSPWLGVIWHNQENGLEFATEVGVKPKPASLHNDNFAVGSLEEADSKPTAASSVETPAEAASRGDTIVVRLRNLLQENSTEDTRGYLEQKFAASGYKGHFDDMLIEYCLERDPVELLEELYGAPQLMRMCRLHCQADTLLENLFNASATDLSRLLLKSVGFRPVEKAKGIHQIIENMEAARNRVRTSHDATQMRGFVLEAGRTLEGILRDLIRFFGSRLLPVPHEKYLKDYGWNRDGKPIASLTLGSLFEVLRNFEAGIAQGEPASVAEKFRELFPGKTFFSAEGREGLSAFITARNDIVHFRERVQEMDTVQLRDYAEQMYGFALTLLHDLNNSGTYPRIISVRSYVEDAYGRRHIECVDDTGKTEKIFTDEQLEPGYLYFMHPTTNPVRIFPILIRV